MAADSGEERLRQANLLPGPVQPNLSVLRRWIVPLASPTRHPFQSIKVLSLVLRIFANPEQPLTITSPLAGGFLTGKLAPASSASDLKGTRFEVSDSNPLGKAARHWYDKPSMHEVNERLRALAQEQDIPMEALAMRWLLYHSALEEEDGVIFGASNPRQAGKTINTIKAGPLLKDMAAKSFRSCGRSVWKMRGALCHIRE